MSRILMILFALFVLSFDVDSAGSSLSQEDLTTLISIQLQEPDLVEYRENAGLFQESRPVGDNKKEQRMEIESEAIQSTSVDEVVVMANSTSAGDEIIIFDANVYYREGG